MELEIRAEILKVVIVWQLVGNLGSQCDCSFVRPASGHVSDGVAPSSQKHEGQVVLLHELDALGMALDSDIEASQSISGQGIGSALKNNRRRLIAFHDFRHDGDKCVLVAFIIDAVSHGEVDGVVFASTGSNVLNYDSFG